MEQMSNRENNLRLSHGRILNNHSSNIWISELPHVNIPDEEEEENNFDKVHFCCVTNSRTDGGNNNIFESNKWGMLWTTALRIQNTPKREKPLEQHKLHLLTDAEVFMTMLMKCKTCAVSPPLNNVGDAKLSKRK